MHRKWRVGTFPEEVWIVLGAASALPDTAASISPENADWRVAEWFPEGGLARQVLVEIHEALGGAFGARPELGLAQLQTSAREALRAGVLRAYEVQLQLSGVIVEKEPEKPREQARAVEEKTWIAIELMDDDDPPKPVPYKKYRIELPDQSTREGMLDANGQARVAGIDPGTCKVSFPQIHGADWELA